MVNEAVKCAKCGKVTTNFLVAIGVGALCQKCHKKFHDLVYKKIGKIQ